MSVYTFLCTFSMKILCPVERERDERVSALPKCLAAFTDSTSLQLLLCSRLRGVAGDAPWNQRARYGLEHCSVETPWSDRCEIADSQRSGSGAQKPIGLNCPQKAVSPI